MRVYMAIAAGLCSATVLGCATVDEFRALEREVVELKRTRNMPSDQQQRIADLGVEARELRQEVARLQGTVESLEFTVSQLREELEMRGPAGVGSSSLGSSTGSGSEGEVPRSGLGAEVAAYEEAFRLYRAEDYPTAISQFRDFLKTYPESEYADNALFWLGDCYFKQGDFASAAVAFEDVSKKYPEGSKVPDALYRQGLALLEIGGSSGQAAAYRGAAQEIFQKILDAYPDSERAPEARRQLEKLGT